MNHLYQLIFGQILNPLHDKKCDFLVDGCLLLKKVPTKIKSKKNQYIIEKMGTKNELLPLINSLNPQDLFIHHFEDYLIMPGFFDMHFHWVQDDVRMMPKDSLLEWLKLYTWPYEAQFADIDFTYHKAQYFFQRLSNAGTLGGAIYSSIHGHALEAANQFARGDFIIGNVLMTMNSPEYLQQTSEEALSLVEKYAKKFGTHYALTPRFAPSTHPEVMKKAFELISPHQSFIQTHLSETKDEIDYVLSLYKDFQNFEDIKSYTEIYHRSKMLTPKTILGHGIYLSDNELEILSAAGSSVAHCPTSNAPIAEKGLGSGLCDTEKLEKFGVRWALGSDIGGGPFLSMFDVMRSYVQQNDYSKHTTATFTKALYRATHAGADILGLGESHGQLKENFQANFIIVPSPRTQSFQSTQAESVLKSLIESYQDQRVEYDHLVKWTFYQGNLISNCQK